MNKLPEENPRARSRRSSGSRSQSSASESSAPGIVEQALTLLKKRKWVILQAIVVVTAVAVFLTSRQETEYTASASLLFRDSSPLLEAATGAPVDERSVDRAAATNEALAALPEVSNRAARRLGKRTSGPEVQDAVNVNSSGDSDVVTIEATSTSPKLAAAIANAYSFSYIAARRGSDQKQIRKSIKLLEDSLASLSAEDQAGTTGADLKLRLERLRVAEKLQTGRAEVVQEATAPADPSSPDWRRNIVLAIAAGTLFGFFLASLFERLDRRLKEPDDLEDVFEVSVLALIPRSRGLRRGRRTNPGRFYAAASGDDAEPFRGLRSNLRFAAHGAEMRSLVVASPSSGDGKSTVARALAVAMASMGDSVVLVDADLRKPDPYSIPGPADEVSGLSNVLEGNLELSEALAAVPVGSDPVSGEARSLVELPSGPERERALELVEGERMRAVMAELESQFDTVILDSPAVLAFADALSLASTASMTIVVVGLGETKRQQAVEAEKRLAAAEANVVGVVANYWAPAREDAYYGYQRPRAGLLR